MTGTVSEATLPPADPKKLVAPLLEKLSAYDPKCDRDAVERAMEFAVQHHGDQRRHSGDAYFHHPLEVAEILTEFKLDTSTIITALLHDTVEDTTATLEDIKRSFGEDIARLVDGVTKLTRLESQSYDEHQAENFRKLLLAISEDIRVLLVKLADRLHNMRTLHFIKKPPKRQRIARETLDIYAALAERIGMQRVKDELEDIAFRELVPEGHASVTSRMEYLRESGTDRITRTTVELKELLDAEGIPAEVKGREKRPYAIWRKMQRKNISFEMLSDITAFRILVNNVQDCYRVLGAIHAVYHTVPGKFKDYISTPKSNGYQSIHTVVMGPENQRVEIQIRTREMHEIAEMGVAAHWSYKQDRDYSTDGKQFKWVRELLNIIENTARPEEFMENTRLEMYQDQVFCFTPKGDLIALPRGATPVDFAFAVHTEVGRSTVGAKINSRIMPLRTQLKNGDQVEILTSKSQQPAPSWEHFVVTGRAKAEIRRILRLQQRGEYVRLGKSMLEQAVLGIEEELHEEKLKPLLPEFRKEKLEDLYAAIGEGVQQRQEVVKALFPEKFKPRKSSLLSRFGLGHKEKKAEGGGMALPVTGLIPGMAIHFAGCCHPLPGEKIVGIVNTGKGVTLHAADCKELENFVDSPERWVDVSWQKDTGEEMFSGRIHVVLSNQTGALADLANTIAHAESNITNIRITNRAPDFYEMVVDVDVKDIEHLKSIMAMLRTRSIVQDVDRY